MQSQKKIKRKERSFICCCLPFLVLFSFAFFFRLLSNKPCFFQFTNSPKTAPFKNNPVAKNKQHPSKNKPCFCLCSIFLVRIKTAPKNRFCLCFYTTKKKQRPLIDFPFSSLNRIHALMPLLVIHKQ